MRLFAKLVTKTQNSQIFVLLILGFETFLSTNLIVFFTYSTRLFQKTPEEFSGVSEGIFLFKKAFLIEIKSEIRVNALCNCAKNYFFFNLKISYFSNSGACVRSTKLRVPENSILGIFQKIREC